MTNQRIILYVSSALFLICFYFGLILAEHKPLWNDELYTQMSSIKGVSYLGMVEGKIEEGSVSPLFYLIQKGWCSVFRYSTPPQWKKGNWDYRHLPSQIFLRVGSILYMSIAVVAIFIFFAWFYSLWAGLYSIVVSLSSYMLWTYYAEARPYALLVCLLTLQTVICLSMIKAQKPSRAHWSWLAIVNVLLALTSVLAVYSTLATAVLLWLWVERRWKRYLINTVLPIEVMIFYYSRTPQYDLWFLNSPREVVAASFPADRLLIVVLFAIWLGWYFFRNKNRWKEIWDAMTVRLGIPVLLLVAAVLAGAIFNLILLKIKEVHPAIAQGPCFPVSARYFIFLLPYSIFSGTLFPLLLFRWLRLQNRWLPFVFAAAMALLVGLRAEKTFQLIRGIYPGLFL